ncbi:MAG: hypothetical protein LBG27_06430 [Spirochaetaceae bacterium]|jgi:hypothetical protein|nr:hypothetical protein [Spirochaetaceae bacterium]
MKTRRLFVGISAMVFVLVPAGCDVSDHDGVFELRLRGTWETYKPSDAATAENSS